MNGVLCWDCNIIFLIYSAKLWDEKVGRLCTMEEAGFLKYRFLFRDHFLPTDFMTPEGIRLNRLSVPCGLDSALHSIPQSLPPLLATLSNPQPSVVSPQNSNLPVLPPLPLTSKLTQGENSPQVLPPLRTYNKLPLSSTHIETPLPIQIDDPSTSSPISVPNPTQAAANIFSVEDNSLSLSLDSSTASDGEFMCFSDQNSSSEPITRHSVLKELDLAMSGLTPRKRKLCQRIRSLAAQVMSHTVAAEIYALVSYGKEQCRHSFCVHNK